jgi:putative transcriptional regulator
MRTNVALYRAKAGLTQEQLAAACGVTRQTIIALEQGRYNPSLGLAAAVTRALRRRSIEEVFVLD